MDEVGVGALRARQHAAGEAAAALALLRRIADAEAILAAEGGPVGRGRGGGRQGEEAQGAAAGLAVQARDVLRPNWAGGRCP